MTRFEKLRGIAHATVVIVGVTTLLFLAVNGVVVIMTSLAPSARTEPGKTLSGVAIWPQRENGQAILAASLGPETAARIKKAIADLPEPNFSMHPSLHYIVTPTRNDSYTIGLQGVRYVPGWTDDDVRSALAGTRPLVLLLGGSTTMGHGLADRDTIAAFLQEKMGKKAWILNLGAMAYDQNREIERLVYLLRQGVRPAVVIFLDGINDITDVARSNYGWIDKVVYHGFVAGKGDVTLPDKAFEDGASDRIYLGDYLRLLARSVPVSRYVFDRLRPRLDPEKIPLELDPFKDRFDYAMQGYCFAHWGRRGDRNIAFYKKQLIETYARNGAFIETLASCFGFKAHIFYQPNGMVDPNNVFNGNPTSDMDGYRYLRAMDQAIREAIAAKAVPMIDLTGTLDDLVAANRAYIDPAHYSPEGNRRLADILFGYLARDGL